jgi:hypothetical protein
MQGSRAGGRCSKETELAVLRFHQLYKELPPTELFPHVQQYQQAVTGLLDQSQPIQTRRRLCSTSGHLAGLRAWLTFDPGDPAAAPLLRMGGGHRQLDDRAGLEVPRVQGGERGIQHRLGSIGLAQRHKARASS